jgi:hypothetical protein
VYVVVAALRPPELTVPGSIQTEYFSASGTGVHATLNPFALTLEIVSVGAAVPVRAKRTSTATRPSRGRIVGILFMVYLRVSAPG